MSGIGGTLAYARAHRSRFVAELREFIRFPTISAQPRHARDLQACAAWLARHLHAIGMESIRVLPTQRHPLVYAEWRHRPGRPTVLIYGHYDVQPVDPLREWHSPPFEPVIRGDELFGRGACDDKGQLFAQVKALESFLRGSGALPVNVKCLFEGEEEIGSPNLRAFLARDKAMFGADAVVVSDMPILAPDQPAITYALRGHLTMDVEVRGPSHDLHSGIFGGAIYNPLQALCDIVASLHDAGGRVTIPGFYDRVRSVTSVERHYLARVGPTEARILRDARVGKGWGEDGYTLYERTTLRPALIVNGITGGYSGAGSKAIIPAGATAKLGFRLVPDQDPGEIEALVRRHIARLVPAAVRCAIRTHSDARPALVDRRHPAVRAAVTAYRKGFGVTPEFLRLGGTIPVVSTFQEMLGAPTVLMGFALPGDRMHAPNEKFHLPNYFKGIDTCAWFLSELGAMETSTPAPRLERHMQGCRPQRPPASGGDNCRDPGPVRPVIGRDRPASSRTVPACLPADAPYPR